MRRWILSSGLFSCAVTFLGCRGEVVIAEEPEASKENKVPVGGGIDASQGMELDSEAPDSGGNPDSPPPGMPVDGCMPITTCAGACVTGAHNVCGMVDGCEVCQCCVLDDAGSSDGSFEDATSPPPDACNALVPGGAEILTAYEQGPPPNLGEGGTIVDGVYDLVQNTIYGSTTPTSNPCCTRETIRIWGGGTVFDSVTCSAGGACEWATQLFMPIGEPMGELFATCPGIADAGNPIGPRYAATPVSGDSLAIVITPPPYSQFLGVDVEVFALR
jgi:hypothetical protein